jgi:hypothetical protein
MAGPSDSGLFKFEQPPPFSRSRVLSSIGGLMMNRNSNATLSPREFRALRALQQDSGRPLSGEEQRLLLSMGLAVSTGETMLLSDAGRARLELEEGASR